MSATPDWQTWVTLAIGLLALAYLVRRWWPRTGAIPADTDGNGCGTGQPGASTGAYTGAYTGASTGASSGGCQGCSGGCSAPTTPMRWHPARPTKH